MSSQPSGRPSERVLNMLSTAEDALLQHDQPNAVKALRPLLVLLGPDTDEFEAIAWVIRELDGAHRQRRPEEVTADIEAMMRRAKTAISRRMKLTQVAKSTETTWKGGLLGKPLDLLAVKNPSHWADTANSQAMWRLWSHHCPVLLTVYRKNAYFGAFPNHSQFDLNKRNALEALEFDPSLQLGEFRLANDSKLREMSDSGIPLVSAPFRDEISLAKDAKFSSN